jgi:hypothetical protein
LCLVAPCFTIDVSDLSYRQVLVTPVICASLVSGSTQSLGQIGTNHGDVVRKPSYCLEELSEQDEHAVALYHKSDEWPVARVSAHQFSPSLPVLDIAPPHSPPHENQQDATPERRRAPPLLFPREEGECALRTEKEGYTDEEEDITHGEERTIKEEDEAEDEEAATFEDALA